jgi:hypothetical protein
MRLQWVIWWAGWPEEEQEDFLINGTVFLFVNRKLFTWSSYAQNRHVALKSHALCVCLFLRACFHLNCREKKKKIRTVRISLYVSRSSRFVGDFAKVTRKETINHITSGRQKMSPKGAFRIFTFRIVTEICRSFQFSVIIGRSEGKLYMNSFLHIWMSDHLTI